MGDAVKQTGEFVGRCDSCGDAIYDYQNRYLVTIGGQDFTLCPCCCIRIDRKRPPKTNGLVVREYTDEEFADFLTWVQQDAYAYGDVDGYGGMAYPNTYMGWLKWFGEEEGEWEERPFDCPLAHVPPHGDLIDRREAIIDANERAYDFWLSDDEVNATIQFLNEQTTIIPAEEGET